MVHPRTKRLFLPKHVSPTPTSTASHAGQPSSRPAAQPASHSPCRPVAPARQRPARSAKTALHREGKGRTVAASGGGLFRVPSGRATSPPLSLEMGSPQRASSFPIADEKRRDRHRPAECSFRASPSAFPASASSACLAVFPGFPRHPACVVVAAVRAFIRRHVVCIAASPCEK